ncbi:MAG: beta-lactamase family protein, partial [Catenulispora sp.]|nr:beta-lactamase family protein [Catenulispora sp.]
IGVLWEAGRVSLDDRLDAHLADTVGYPLGGVTVHNLLTHTAGVPLRSQLRALYGADPDAVRRGVLQEAAHRPAGEAVEYTDRAALILGYLIEEISGQPLGAFARSAVWDSLRMRATGFGPMPAFATSRCAPTERDDTTGEHLRGVAHDFSARLLGGVCGIAGAFATAEDLGSFATHLLAPSNGARFGAKWVSESLRIHTGDLVPARGLFWHPAPGTEPADDIWVHYGFTGTGLWISPKHDRWATLLTNKLYYTRDREPIAEVRNAFRALVFADGAVA